MGVDDSSRWKIIIVKRDYTNNRISAFYCILCDQQIAKCITAEECLLDARCPCDNKILKHFKKEHKEKHLEILMKLNRSHCDTTFMWSDETL